MNKKPSAHYSEAKIPSYNSMTRQIKKWPTPDPLIISSESDCFPSTSTLFTLSQERSNRVLMKCFFFGVSSQNCGKDPVMDHLVLSTVRKLLLEFYLN